jgi:2,3-bisphosphoglycerate-independent phosphoglycerate mutase
MRRLVDSPEEMQRGPGHSISIYPGIEHRFVIVFRGEGLRDDLTDADPQKGGLSAKGTEGLSPEAQKTSVIVNEFIKKATEVLKPFHPANTILLRGFSKVPDIPSMEDDSALRLPLRPIRCIGD